MRLAVLLLTLAGLGQAQPGTLSALGVDITKANLPLDEILSGGPAPQGIPALGFAGDWRGIAASTRAPGYVSQEEAAEWLNPQEPVIALRLNGEARGYPLQVLTWHEIANDVLGNVPVAVTFCPLCNSAFAFDRRVPLSKEAREAVLARNPEVQLIALDEAFTEAYRRQWDEAEFVAGLEVTFGVSGLLYNSNLLMFDDFTSTLWSQLLGEGNVGALTGTKLLRYPAQIVSFAEFSEAFPEATVLSQDTGFYRDYGRNPYLGYDRADTPPFLYYGPTDGRLPPKARVVSVELGEEVIAYPFSLLEEAHVLNDEVAGKPLVVFWSPGTASALDQARIAASQDVGAVGVFERTLENVELNFRWDGEAFIDEQTGSRWNLLGQAVSGELSGKALTPVVHDNTLWFAWAAFKPETRVYFGD